MSWRPSGQPGAEDAGVAGIQTVLVETGMPADLERPSRLPPTITWGATRHSVERTEELTALPSS